MPFPDHSFDHVFCISVLEHLGSDWFDVLDALDELVRVCRDRITITVDYNRTGVMRWNPDKTLLFPVGFGPTDFDSFCRGLGIETPELPNDVLKSEATEQGRRCCAGLSVCGFVIKC